MSLNNYDATGAVQAREYSERVFGPGSVGYDEATKGILLNVGGKQYNLGNEGLTLGEDGRYYAPNEDILKSLAISKVGLVPVRNALQADGLSVGWADDKLIVDGNYYNTDNMVNMGGTLYGEPDYLRQLFGNSARFKNPYGQQQSEWLKKLMGRRFSYDPESDSALQEAQKQAQRSAMRDLARRGIINSTDAAHYTGLVTSQFIPQYEKMAFDRYKEENQIITNVLDTLTKMNSSELQTWKANNEQQYNNAALTMQQEQNAREQQRKSIEEAWRRTEARGYVSPEDARILNVQPGTAAASARLAYENRMYALELEDYKSQNRLRELYEEYRLKEMLAEASANIDVRAQKELLPLKKR